MNDAYINGATDFMHSKVQNNGCLVMDIDNEGASYNYVPGSEVHESSSFAIGLCGLDLSSADAFAYSLGRSLAASAASAGVGLLASEAGLGGFISSIAASLAGTYVNTEVFPQPEAEPQPNAGNTQQEQKESKMPGISSNSNVSFSRNGRGFHAENLDFNKKEVKKLINDLKAQMFNEALDKNLPTNQALAQTQKKMEEFSKEIKQEQQKIDETAEKIENNENNLRDEVKASIGDEEWQNFIDGKKVSAESKGKIIKSLSNSIRNLQKQKSELNLRAPSKKSKTQAASLQAQNELIDSKMSDYDLLGALLIQSEHPQMTRSNSADNLIQDTYIRQAQRILGNAIVNLTGAFAEIAREANSMSQRDYIELQLSRLPAEAQNNPEVLAKIGASYALYKGAAQIGEKFSALDDATGNRISGAFHKIGEGFEWIGTHTRRYFRDYLKFPQRMAQNVGDLTQLAGEIFGPSKVAKGLGSASKLIGASKFRSALGEQFGLYKGTGSVIQEQEMVEWSGQFKLIKNISQTATGTEFASLAKQQQTQIYSSNINTALKERTLLAFEEKGIIIHDEKLTAEATKIKGVDEGGSARRVKSFAELKNSKAKEAMLKLNPNGEWGKYTTKSIKILDGQSAEIHFYMDAKTRQTYLGHDFKIKVNGGKEVSVFGPIKKKGAK